jgi:hypothetical protein
MAKVWQARRFTAAAPSLIEEVFSGLYGKDHGVQRPKWRIARIPDTLSDMQVGIIEFESNYAPIVFYLPGSDSAVESFQRQQSNLADIQASYPDRSWSRMLPELLYEGDYHGRPFWVMQKILGVNGENVVFNPEQRAQFLGNAVQAIRGFHHDTASFVFIGDQEAKAWVDYPIDIICKSPLRFYDCSAKKVLRQLGCNLTEKLIGKPAKVSWVHGDYWAANLIVAADNLNVNGIIDWDYARPGGLPLLDLINLAVSVEMAIEGCELGTVLVRFLTKPAHMFERYGFLEDVIAGQEGAGLSIGDFIVLFWLHHLHANLLKSRRYAWNPVWSQSNFVAVLRCIDTLWMDG